MKTYGCIRCGAPVSYTDGTRVNPKRVLCEDCKRTNYSYAMLPDGTSVCFTQSNIKTPEDRVDDMIKEIRHLKHRIRRLEKK